ncbi:MAG: ABC transporter substrate-binding protein [Candidatus Heimdallarchaeota archaeon]
MLMIKGKKRKKGIYKRFSVFILIILTFSIVSGIIPIRVESIENPEITLIGKARGAYMGLFSFIQEQLRDIGINFEFWTCDCPEPAYHMIGGGGDISIITIRLDKTDPDFSDLYSSSSKFNFPSYNPSIDFNSTLEQGTNDWYLSYGKQILNIDDRIYHYWNWEQYFMDELLCYQPLFSVEHSYVDYWDNLVGYNYSEGLVQSWGKMKWNGTHINQDSTNEIEIASGFSRELNPLLAHISEYYSPYSRNNLVGKLCMDPLIWIDTDGSYWPHLAEEVQFLNNTHYRVRCREGINWQLDPEGLFPNEKFDAYDVYFTYSYLKENSYSTEYYDWIKEMRIIDDYTIDFFVDANPATQINEPYAMINNSFSTLIVPEHFLNQTQLSDGTTPDISHPSWELFSEHCFGTGLFEIGTIDIDQLNAKLDLRINSWHQNSTITNDTRLNWLNRFGDFSGDIDTLRIKGMPIDESTFCLENGYIDIGKTTAFPDDYSSENENIITQSKPGQFMISLLYSLHPSRENISSLEFVGGETNITKGLALRKAISYAIDREELNDFFYQNQYMINDYPIYPTMKKWCNPNIIRYNHDLDQAKDYMELLGFSYDAPSITVGFTNLGIIIITIVTITFFTTKKHRDYLPIKIRRKNNE